MAFINRIKNNKSAKTVTFGGAAPITATGNAVPMNHVNPGCITARLNMHVTTTALIMTPSWQVSEDTVTWEGFKVTSNATQVGTASGTGTSALTTVHIEGPAALSSHRYARAVVVTSGANAAVSAVDSVDIEYDWLEPEFN